MTTLMDDVLNQMNKQLARIETSLNRLTEEQVWRKLHPDTNSVANLCFHLAGNEYQHFVSGIGGKPFIRQRSEEFNLAGGKSKAEILDQLKAVREESAIILGQLTNEDLLREVQVYYDADDWQRMMAGSGAETEPYYIRPIRNHLFAVAEHYGYHTGQIVYMTKLMQAGGMNIAGYAH
ncbi:DUF1572 domain-containing protein [Paenibacillus oenotherae]|uniref:DUF1572 domain-containing protein n=1 Tax=Paenibacillus oenotherae TaxID=1435645 RepID=A0ABS7DCT4_9BACL|nr:DUF1572 family protein [Paenibacillus oenotherae]MBW7477564.1 DUF1572 domain-containing protein [Paenibacillus oenotherae]